LVCRLYDELAVPSAPHDIVAFVRVHPTSRR
jgi:hypothetical protein